MPNQWLQKIAWFLPQTASMQGMRDISLRGWGLQSEAVYQGKYRHQLCTKSKKVFSFRNHHRFGLELTLPVPQLAACQTQTLNRLQLNIQLSTSTFDHGMSNGMSRFNPSAVRQNTKIFKQLY